MDDTTKQLRKALRSLLDYATGEWEPDEEDLQEHGIAPAQAALAASDDGHWIDDLDDPYGLLEDVDEAEALEDARDEAADLKLRNMKYDEAGL